MTSLTGTHSPGRSHTRQHLDTQTIQAKAIASKFNERAYAGFDDVTSIAAMPSFCRSRTEGQSARLGCGRRNSASARRSFAPSSPWGPELCLSASLAEHLRAARIEQSELFPCDGRNNRRANVSARGTFPERLRILWTTLLSKLSYMKAKRSLFDLSPADLVDTKYSAHVNTRDGLVKSTTVGSDLTARISVVIFFRLLASLERSRNTRGILKLIRQVPAMVAGTPALSLLPLVPQRISAMMDSSTAEGSRDPLAGLTAEEIHPTGVVGAVLSAAEKLMSDGHGLSCEEHSEVLSAIVGLAIKRGSLHVCLETLKLLLFSEPWSTGQSSLLHGVACHLKELEVYNGDAKGYDTRYDYAGMADAAPLWIRYDSAEAGVLVSLAQRWERTKDTSSGIKNDGRASVAGILHATAFVKVQSTVSHHVAITADGELLVWNRPGEPSKECARLIPKVGECLPLLEGLGGVSVWKPKLRRHTSSATVIGSCVCTASRTHISSSVTVEHADILACDSNPLVLQMLADRPAVADVACGAEHALALLVCGQVLSWGKGANGRLGIGDARDRATASPVNELQEVDTLRVFCGLSHSLAVSTNGVAYSWGKNNSGQCGYFDPTYPDQLSPRIIEDLKTFVVVAMAGGREHTLALSSCGQVFSFGAGYKNEHTGEIAPVLGISAAGAEESTIEAGNTHGSYLPVRICPDGIGSNQVEAIASGWDHCMILASDGALFTWGAGNGGQLGHGDAEPRHKPTRVDFFATPAGGRVTSVAGGQSHTAAITEDGRLFVWGSECKCDRIRGGGAAGGSDDGHDERALAVNSAVPQPVDGIGGKDPLAMTIGGGPKFDLVLTARRPLENCASSIGSSLASEDLFRRTGLIPPDDPSQPVGRLEVALLMLAHFARFAMPHLPEDPTAEVERRACQALAVRNRQMSRAVQHCPVSRTRAPSKSSSTSHGENSTSQEHQQKPTGKANAADDCKPRTSAPLATVGTQGKISTNTRGLANQFPTPFIPFCVEPSPETFQSFFYLLRNLRKATEPFDGRSSVTSPTVDTRQKTASSACPRVFNHASKVGGGGGADGRKSPKDLDMASVVGNVGPETSSCTESLSEGLPCRQGFGENDAKSNPSGLAMAPPAIERNILRSLLNLLKINLFNLSCAAGIRRASRDEEEVVRSSSVAARSSSPNPEGLKAFSLESDHEGSTAQARVDRNSCATRRGQHFELAEHAQARPEACSRSTSRLFRESSGTRNARGSLIVDEGIDENYPGLQGAILQSFGHKEEHPLQTRGTLMRSILEGIHYELWRLMEGEGKIGTTDEIDAVMIEAAETFRVGFGIFYPCNEARTDLFRDVINSIKGTVDNNLGISWNARGEQNSAHRDVCWNRSRLTVTSNWVPLQAVTAELARDSYTAALVADALDGEGKILEPTEKTHTDCALIEEATGRWSKGSKLDVAELGSAMKSLLVHCVNDFAGHLFGLTNGTPKPETISCSKSLNRTTIDEKCFRAMGCPHVSLLLALQAHIFGAWSDAVDKNSACALSVRQVAVSHGIRVFEASFQVLAGSFGSQTTAPRGASDEHSRNAEYTSGECARHSFLALVPLLCASLVALPMTTRGHASAALLPSLMPLVGAVDRFNRARVAVGTERNTSPRSLDEPENATCSRWMTDLEEAVTALSAELICSLMEEGAIKSHAKNVCPACGAIERNYACCCAGSDSGTDASPAGDRNEDTAELLLTSSPFLKHGRDCFQRSSDDAGSDVQPEGEFVDACKVITWADRLAVEKLVFSRTAKAPTAKAAAASKTPVVGRSHTHRNGSHRRRRASGDRSEKLSPLDSTASVTSSSSQAPTSDAQARFPNSIGSLGDESTGGSLEGSAGGGRRAELLENGKTTLDGGGSGRKGGVSPARQLDSVVDGARAEGFIQDLLAGQGAAQTLYQWFAAPPTVQSPVLHATSLANQGQGWGSYQALSSQTVPSSRPHQGQDNQGAPRRRRFSALSSDVDAAARALIGVVIKSNGLVAEAATFAKCRLDRASSPPPSLRLVASAAAEAREALSGFVEAHEREEDIAKEEKGRGDRFLRDSANRGNDRSDVGTHRVDVTTTLRAIVRNCQFLLRCSCLPKISLTRARCQKQKLVGRGQRSSSHLPSNGHEPDRGLSGVLRRWADNSAKNEESTFRKEGTKFLALVCEQMAQGQVAAALSTAAASESRIQLSECVGLESLMAFTASPVHLEQVELETRTQELRAKLRATGFRLVRQLLDDANMSSARHHIVTRLARALQSFAEDRECTTQSVRRPNILSSVRRAGSFATARVHSAYVELCSFIVHALSEEILAPDIPDSPRPPSNAISTLLILLRMLVEKLPPPLVEHTAGGTGLAQLCTPTLEGASCTSWNSGVERKATDAGSGWPNRAGGNASSSISGVDANASPASSVLGTRSFALVASAVTVIGDILDAEGAQLSKSVWGPSADGRRCATHRAAWRALCALSTHLSLKTTRLSGKDVAREHGVPVYSGSSRASSADKQIKVTSAGVQQSCIVVQKVLSVLLTEATRVHDQLNTLMQYQEAYTRVAVATQARRLVTTPAPVPFPLMSVFSRSIESKRDEDFSATFWIWIPATLPRSTQTPRDACMKGGGLLQRDRPSPFFSRAIICTCVHKDVPVGETADARDEEYFEVSLTLLCGDGETEQRQGCVESGDGVHVVFTISKSADRGPLPSSDGESDGKHRTPRSPLNAEVASSDGSTVDPVVATSSDDGETSYLVTGRLISAQPLPLGHWTHVCCSHSTNQEDADAAANATEELPHPRLPIALLAFNGRVVAKRVGSGSNAIAQKRRSTSGRGELRIGEEHGRSLKGEPHSPFAAPSTVNLWRTGPVVCDLHWHNIGVSTTQANDFVITGVPRQREEEVLAADCYASRVISLAHALALSSQRVASVLSSSRWLAMWLAMVPVTRFEARRGLLRLLRLLLCTGDDTSDSLSLQNNTADSRDVGCDLKHHLDDRLIVENLCALLGGEVVALRGSDASCDVEKSRDDLKRIVVANKNRKICDKSRYIQRCESAPILFQKSSIIPEIVLLLRALLRESPKRWRRHVDAALSDSLATNDTGELRALSTAVIATNVSPTTTQADSQAESTRQRLVLVGAALAAAYIGGGHIEGPRIGGRVTVMPMGLASVEHPNCGAIEDSEDPAARNTQMRKGCGKDAVAPDDISVEKAMRHCAFRGIVVGVDAGTEVCDYRSVNETRSKLVVVIDDAYSNRVGEVPSRASRAHQSSVCPSGSESPSSSARACLVEVPLGRAVWEAKFAEPITPFLFNDVSLAAIQVLLESITTKKPFADACTGTTRPRRGIDTRPSRATILSAHLRCRLVRALAVQFRHARQAALALRGGIVDALLKLSVAPLKSVTVLALGLDSAVQFERRRDFSAVVLSLDHQRGDASPLSLMGDLQTACQAAWTNMSTDTAGTESQWLEREGSDARTSYNYTDWYRGTGHLPSLPQPVLQVLGGGARVEGDRVTASSHFPTIRLSDVRANSQSVGGRWYYEATLLTGGLMQLGWAASSFECSPVRGQGVGDHMHSWAFDGFRQKRWCVSSAPYGKRWRAGDVVGVLLDAALQEISFSLNGHDLGVAFVGFDPEGLFPAASMNVGQAARFNFGYSPFLYPQADSDEAPFRPIAEAAIQMPTARAHDVDMGVSAHESRPDLTPQRHEQVPTESNLPGVAGDTMNEPSDAEGRCRVECSLREGETRGGRAARLGMEDAGSSSLCGGTRGDDAAGAEGTVVDRELQRQSLVENLIAMGFPVEWAIRAAERSADAVMSESAATAWIIERLEIENTRIEEEMGNMDNGEEDFSPPASGENGQIEETKVTDDSDFVHDGGGVRMEGNSRREVRQSNGDTSDCSWRGMYSAVRRGFLARGNSDSPVTASSFNAGRRGQEADASPNDTAADIPTAGMDGGSFSREVPTHAPVGSSGTMSRVKIDASSGLLRMVLSARDKDLPSLSVVLETALSILFARAAVVNLVSHVGGNMRRRKKWHPDRSPYAFPWYRIQSRSGNDAAGVIDHGSLQGLRTSQDDDTVESSTARSEGVEFVRRFIHYFADQGSQQRFLDLTKVLISWRASSLPVGTNTYRSAKMPAEVATYSFKGRNSTLEESPTEAAFLYAKAADPIGLFPGSCLLAMHSLFELSSSPSQTWADLGRTPDRRTFSQGSDDKSLTSGALPPKDDPFRMALLALPNFSTLAMDEAIQYFEQTSHTQNVDLPETKSPPAAGENHERQRPSMVPTAVWALWVLATIMMNDSECSEKCASPAVGCTETTSSASSTRPRTGTRMDAVDNEAADCASSEIAAIPFARLPRAFAAVLHSALSGSLDFNLQPVAYSLCASMLSHSLPIEEIWGCRSDGSPCPAVPLGEVVTASNEYQHLVRHSPFEDELLMPSEERALAGAFSVQLRRDISTQRLPSPLLQSQLELLSQWQRRKLLLTRQRERGLHSLRTPQETYSAMETPVGMDDVRALDTSTCPGCRHMGSWDIATPMVAGPSGRGGGFNGAQTTNMKVRRPKRPGTAEIEASAISSLPDISAPDSAVVGTLGSTLLLVESATATSVTLSWGGWLGDDNARNCVGGVDGHGATHAVGLDRRGPVSSLAQALRSKARHATGRRRDHDLSYVLKVAADGLWGSEPFKIAAIDLQQRGCFIVRGLTADTRYEFRLERLGVPTNTPAALTSGCGENSDDERSCFRGGPEGVGNGGSSVGDSSIGPPETDAADGASSVLTGLEQSRGGGSSALSEGGTDAQTDEGRVYGSSSFTSSMRAVAGIDRSSKELQSYALDEESWVWHPGDAPRRHSCISEYPTAEAAAEWALVAAVSVATPPEIPFKLNDEGCGPNLRLSNSNLTVTNYGRKNWSAIRATLGFSSGVQSWKVRIDRCVSKNVFVGVVSAESKLNNYLGSDRLGWGYLANKAIWHNKSKARTYGELFREGDTIGVHLNMDMGTLCFARNGRDLGVAVKGLSGTLYPAFSMYNRNDQLTLVPPQTEDGNTYVPSPVAGSEGGEETSARFGRSAELGRNNPTDLHGTFSAECVIRRAARSLAVFDILNYDKGFESFDGRMLLESISNCLAKDSSGHRRKSLSSFHACAPVRLDTSGQARRDFVGLGAGDRVLSTEGEATVLGATRHSLWVALEAPTCSTASPSGVTEATRAWGTDLEDAGESIYAGVRRGHNPAPIAFAKGSTSSTACMFGERKSKIIPWSRRTVRQITGCPEEFVIYRDPQVLDTQSLRGAHAATLQAKEGLGNQLDEADIPEMDSQLPSMMHLGTMLSQWTSSMDEALRRRLENLADSLVVGSPFNIPSKALKDLSAATDEQALLSNLPPIDLQARAALLFHVNDLVLPLLPLLDASANELGPLAAMVRKCRHLLFTEAKLELLHTSTRSTAESLPSCSAQDSSSGCRVSLKGFQPLPGIADGVGDWVAKLGEQSASTFCATELSWAQRSILVEMSVFGQLAERFSQSSLPLSNGPMAFTVELVNPTKQTDGASSDQLLDAYELYRGVFWQVCKDVFESPISMFISPVSRTTPEARALPRNSGDRDKTDPKSGTRPSMPWMEDGAIPDPLFTSTSRSSEPNVDPIRLDYYHSLGFIFGLAARTGVPLPLPRLAPRWWMLVAQDDVNSLEAGAAAETGMTSNNKPDKPGEERPRNSNRDKDASISSLSAEERSVASTVNGVLAALGRLGGTNTVSQEKLDEILDGARFVGPRSDGCMMELTPGGASRPVKAEDIEEFSARLTWSRASEYAPQAAAFRAGLETALPCHVLSLLTWREMEALVCGKRDYG